MDNKLKLPKDLSLPEDLSLPTEEFSYKLNPSMIGIYKDCGFKRIPGYVPIDEPGDIDLNCPDASPKEWFILNPSYIMPDEHGRNVLYRSRKRDMSEQDFNQFTEATNIVIPSHYNNIPVEVVSAEIRKTRYNSSGDSVGNYHNVTRLKFCDGPTHIENNMRTGDGVIEELILPNTLIKLNCNFGNNSIYNLNIPRSTKYISNGAFSGNRLSFVSVPSGLEYIGERAFDSNEIVDINVEEGLVELRGFGHNRIEELTGLPSSLRVIGGFNGNGMTKLVLPEGLREIEEYAFSSRSWGDNANSLKNLSIPNSVEIIGGRAFHDIDIETLRLGRDLREIGASAFSINELTELTLPNNLKVVGNSAFSANYIENISIPDSVDFIGDRAFSNYAPSPIQNLKLGSGIKHIGYGAFSPHQVNEIIIPDGVKTIGELAFEYQCWTPSNRELRTNLAVIPDSVESMGDWAISNGYVYNHLPIDVVYMNMLPGDSFDGYTLIARGGEMRADKVLPLSEYNK